MFLVIFLKNGDAFIHGNDRTAESKNLLAVEDERGTMVVQKLFAARTPKAVISSNTSTPG